MRRASIEVYLWKIGFPAKAEIHGEFLIYFPCIVRVEPNRLGSIVLFNTRSFLESGDFPHEIVRQAEPRRLAIEREIHKDGCGIGIQPPRQRIRAKSQLVVAANNAQVITCAKGCDSRRTALCGNRESTGDIDPGI